jgi:branched-chain amino acid transport system substrate-binding protein
LIFVDKVPAIVGPVGSSVTLAVAPIAEKEKVVIVSPTATNPRIRTAGDYVFRVVSSDALQGKVLAEVAFAKLGARRAAVLYMNNDYGVGLKDVFEKTFAALGGSIVASEGFQGGDKDFRTQLTKFKARNSDVIFLPGHHTETGLALKQARELGLNVPFLGGDGSLRPELITIAGNAAEGSVFSTMSWGTGTADEAVQSFVSAFEKKYGKKPGVFSALAYDATKVVALAIERGGVTGPEIQAAMAKIKDFKGATGVTSFDEYGEVEKPFSVFIVRGGEFTPFQ